MEKILWKGLMVVLMAFSTECCWRAGGHYKGFYMDRLCRPGGPATHKINVDTAIRLELSSRSHYPGNMVCTVDFSTRAGRKLLIRVTRLKLRFSNPRCERFAKLEIFRGSTTGGLSPVSGPLCGSSSAAGQYSGGTQEMAVRFVSRASDRGRFMIVATSYRDADARRRCFNSKDYRCSNVNYCIPASLICDGYNNCFDGSDEWVSTCVSRGICNRWCRLAVGIVVGVLALVALAVLITLCCCGFFTCFAFCACCHCCNKKQRRGQNHRARAESPDPVSTVTTTQVNYGFIKDAPPPYPGPSTAVYPPTEVAAQPPPTGFQVSQPYPQSGATSVSAVPAPSAPYPEDKAQLPPVSQS